MPTLRARIELLEREAASRKAIAVLRLDQMDEQAAWGQWAARHPLQAEKPENVHRLRVIELSIGGET